MHNTISISTKKANEARVSIDSQSEKQLLRKSACRLLLSRTLQHQRLLRKCCKVHLRMIRRHVFARRDTMDFHPWVILKTAEEFGRDEEILAATATVFAMRGAGDVDQARVDEAGILSVRGIRSQWGDCIHTVRCEGPCPG